MRRGSRVRSGGRRVLPTSRGCPARTPCRRQVLRRHPEAGGRAGPSRLWCASVVRLRHRSVAHHDGVDCRAEILLDDGGIGGARCEEITQRSKDCALAELIAVS